MIFCLISNDKHSESGKYYEMFAGISLELYRFRFPRGCCSSASGASKEVEDDSASQLK